MGILIWLVLGAVAGWLAGLLMKGGGFGLLGNIIVGILGSIIGGYAGNALGISEAQATGFNVPSILTAVAGAVILLFIVGLFRKAT